MAQSYTIIRGDDPPIPPIMGGPSPQTPLGSD